MATYEKAEQELNDAKKELKKANDVLARFEGGKYGQKLTELEDKECEAELTEEEEKLLKKLEGVKKTLEERKEECLKQVEELQHTLAVTTAAQPGNDFAT